jgi:site-specific recombinase XerD
MPGSPEFMEAYQAALDGTPPSNRDIGKAKTVAGTVHALVAAYLDCSPTSSSPFRLLAAETQRTQKNILERFREAHGEKRIYSVSRRGIRKLELTSDRLQRIVNQKSNTPFGQRNFLKTLRAMFKWAASEKLIPDDPTIGVTRNTDFDKKSKGYATWSEQQIAQFRRKHPIGSMARLAIELLLATGARRADAVRLGAQHMRDGGITGKRISFEQSKTKGLVNIPLNHEFLEALAAMPEASAVSVSGGTTFLRTNSGRPFASAASFGNWFRDCCNAAGLYKGLSAHGLRKATARRLAEAGCSEHEIAAVTGHASLSEVRRYTQAANQIRLADQAVSKVLRDK